MQANMQPVGTRVVAARRQNVFRAGIHPRVVALLFLAGPRKYGTYHIAIADASVMAQEMTQ